MSFLEITKFLTKFFFVLSPLSLFTQGERMNSLKYVPLEQMNEQYLKDMKDCKQIAQSR